MRYRIVIDMEAPTFDIVSQLFTGPWVAAFEQSMRTTLGTDRTFPYRILAIVAVDGGAPPLR
jgi:hypothetical protein